VPKAQTIVAKQGFAGCKTFWASPAKLCRWQSPLRLAERQPKRRLYSFASKWSPWSRLSCGDRCWWLDTIACPHGRFDSRVVAAARASGFAVGLTCTRTAVTPRTNPLALGRVVVLLVAVVVAVLVPLPPHPAGSMITTLAITAAAPIFTERSRCA
jgi:hypothetical protein